VGSTGLALLAIAGTLLAAALGAWFSYLQAVRTHRSEARLDRLNAQLSDLYGPLYATLESSRIAHRAFVDVLRPGRESLFDPEDPLSTEQELRLWREWVVEVLHPRATRAHELITSRAHLLIEDTMPEFMLRFCAHKAGYDALIKRWERGDYKEHLSVVRHPGAVLYDYLRDSFIALKQEQAQELAIIQGPPKTVRTQSN
jgi:hypothetical protein